MSTWAKAVMNEYPNFNIVGEVWTGEPSFLAGYQGSSKLKDFDTHLPSVTDFGMRDVLTDFLKDNNGIEDFYNLLAKDYLYANINNLITFIDNHDVGRAMFQTDVRHAFTQEGKPENENEIYNFFETILVQRKKLPSLSKGKLTHFAVQDDVYIHFKPYENEVVLNIINANEQ